MRFLAEQERGFPAGDSLVPIVPGAIIFDLSLGASGAYPTPEMAYRACEQSDRIVQEGSVGAGVGATVGNILGQDQAMKGGVGTAAVVSDSGVTVAALAVVNAFGDVMEPDGTIIAGTRHPATGELVNTSAVLAQGQHAGQEGQNTTLVVVATDAELDKTQLKRLACVSHNGLARTLAPAHSPFDGDAVFAVSVGSRKADMAVLGTLGGTAVERAVLRGITEAEPIEGIPAYSG
jgi:L-aminopeptidase/D-esterase-like protein